MREEVSIYSASAFERKKMKGANSTQKRKILIKKREAFRREETRPTI